MDNLTMIEMQNMQKELWEIHKKEWSPMTPEYGKNFILWMMGEVGEVIDIVKKNDNYNLMQNPVIRNGLVEELCDVLMYFNDVLLRYGITPEEFASSYRKKHKTNMSREYK